MFEVFVRMPSFYFDTDDYIEATVTSEYTFDKVGGMNSIVDSYGSSLVAGDFHEFYSKGRVR